MIGVSEPYHPQDPQDPQNDQQPQNGQDPRPDDRPAPPVPPAGQQPGHPQLPGFPQQYPGTPQQGAGYPQQFPSYPQQYSATPQQWAPAGGYPGGPAPQPGVTPLRPLSIGEVLGAGVRIARANGAALIILALVLNIVTTLISVGLTALSGSLSDLVSGQWVIELLEGRRTTLPTALWVNIGSGLILGLLSFAVMYGVATAFVARGVVGRSANGIVAERLKGRWPVLLGVGAIVSLLSALGMLLFIVPGVLLYLVWIVAMPVAVMERTGVGQALQRSVELTRGHKGRIFGIVMAWFGINVGVTLVVNRLVLVTAGSVGTTSYFVVQLIVTALVSALFQAWLAAMVAVIYVDLRIRNENLGPVLAAAAAQYPPDKPAA